MTTTRHAAAAALSLLLAAATIACAGTNQAASIEALQADRRTLDYKLQSLRATAERDQRLRDLEAQALERVRRVDAQTLDGQEPFISVHRAYLTALFETVVPFGWEQQGFTFRFTGAELELAPESMSLKLPYTVAGAELQGSSEAPLTGRLGCELTLLRDPADGNLKLHVEPRTLETDDRDYRSARVLQTRFNAASFVGLLPDLPLPVGLPETLTWEKRSQSVEVRFDPQRTVVLPERLIVPFDLVLRQAPARPAEPAPGAPLPGDEQPKIPTGLTPGRTD